jgi:hypothetical protein
MQHCYTIQNLNASQEIYLNKHGRPKPPSLLEPHIIVRGQVRH